MILRLAAFFLLAFLGGPVSLSALEIPEKPEGYLSDYAHLLSPSLKTRLEERLRQFETETSNQLVVVTFPSLEGEALEDFSIRLAEAWKIGQKGKDNGIILLIFKQDRAVRIEVGYGLEGALPDATAKVIIENEIVPRFREGRFDEGIEKAIEAVILAAKGEYLREQPRGRNWIPIARDTFGIWIPLAFVAFFQPLILWIFAAVSIVVGFFALFFLGESLLASLCFGFAVFLVILYFLLRLFFPGKMVLSRDGSIWKKGGYWGGGLGGGGFGGGGFSGGGGGFGGGGASGGW